LALAVKSLALALEAKFLALALEFVALTTATATATAPTKKFADVFSPQDRMHERNRQSDGHRATTKTALMHSVAR